VAHPIWIEDDVFASWKYRYAIKKNKCWRNCGKTNLIWEIMEKKIIKNYEKECILCERKYKSNNDCWKGTKGIRHPSIEAQKYGILPKIDDSHDIICNNCHSYASKQLNFIHFQIKIFKNNWYHHVSELERFRKKKAGVLQIRKKASFDSQNRTEQLWDCFRDFHSKKEIRWEKEGWAGLPHDRNTTTG